eukprot:8308808-Alexandrium_andersonii.AAC.1
MSAWISQLRGQHHHAYQQSHARLSTIDRAELQRSPSSVCRHTSSPSPDTKWDDDSGAVHPARIHGAGGGASADVDSWFAMLRDHVS